MCLSSGSYYTSFGQFTLLSQQLSVEKCSPTLRCVVTFGFVYLKMWGVYGSDLKLSCQPINSLKLLSWFTTCFTLRIWNFDIYNPTGAVGKQCCMFRPIRWAVATNALAWFPFKKVFWQTFFPPFCWNKIVITLNVRHKMKIRSCAIKAFQST